MTNTAPITLEALFRYWRALPHQLAAISELEADLKANGYDAAMRRDRPWFATWSQAGKQTDEAWLAPAAKIIKEFEGLRLAAYKDAVGVLTIGWGHTGPDVTPNLRITQEHAEELLAADMREAAAAIVKAMPSWSNWQANEQAAIISFVFNIGGGAFASSTLVKRIQAGEARRTVIPQELPKWVKGDGVTLPGLVRRRDAEVALFMGPPTQQQQDAVLLQVPYELQHDNTSGAGYRECASSSAAMVAKFWGKVSSDDAYNQIRAKFGDTTDINAHVQALRSLGLDARFRTDGTPALLEAELRAGRPVMVGWLHQGSINNPSGGGHWSALVGYTPTHWIHNDPNGEADMVNGGYVNSTKGKGIHYSRKNWDRRWRPDGNGWCLLVQPM